MSFPVAEEIREITSIGSRRGRRSVDHGAVNHGIRCSAMQLKIAFVCFVLKCASLYIIPFLLEQ